MIERIRRFFESRIGLDEPGGESRGEHAFQLATAALLIEMARADFEIDPVEREQVHAAVVEQFALGTEEAAELVELAELEAAEATSLYQFTGLVNAHFDAPERERLIRMLWDVAVADGRIDRYEDHFVRKIADLIHVPHSAFIRAKHEALNAR